MNNKYYVIFLLITLGAGQIYPQSYKSSLIAEVAGFSAKTGFFMEPDEKELIIGYGVSYSGKLRLDSNFHLELRPGLFLTQTFYEGLQLGLFLRRNFNQQLFGIVGVNSSLNFNGPWRGERPVTLTYTAGVTIGSILSKDFSVLLSFYKTLDDIYGRGSSSTAIFTKYLFWLLKLGIEYNL